MLLCPWDFPGKSTGVGCHFLLQRIFPTQGLNPGLPHCRQTLYHLSHQGTWYKHHAKWTKGLDGNSSRQEWNRLPLLLPEIQQYFLVINNSQFVVCLWFLEPSNFFGKKIDEFYRYFEGFPGGSAVRPGFDPWVRKIPWRRAWQATLVFLPRESQGQRSLADCSLSAVRQSDATKQQLNSIVILRNIGFTSFIQFSSVRSLSRVQLPALLLSHNWKFLPRPPGVPDICSFSLI